MEYANEIKACRAHVVILSVDMRRNISPLQHLWRDWMEIETADQCAVFSDYFMASVNGTSLEENSMPDKNTETIPNADTKSNESVVEVDTSRDDRADVKLRIMTYNLWHTNPASWLYPNIL